MTLLLRVFSEPGVERLGWVLIQFLWEGTVIALGLAVLLRLLAKASSQTRYALAGVALLACAITPVITWTWWIPPEEALLPTAGPNLVSLPPSAENAPEPTVAVPSPKGETSSKTETTWPASLAEAAGASAPYAVALWFAGVIALSTRLTLGWVWIKRLCRSGIPVRDSYCLEHFQSLFGRMRIDRSVQLLESALIEVPTLIGWLRPTILMPVSLFSGLTPEHLEAILAHELAHVRRYDYLINLFQTIIETALFYHPAIWWISRRLREERENCCDDIALEVLQDRLVYVSALAQLEEGRVMQLALTASGGSLLQRIRRIVGVPNREPSAPPIWLIIVCLAFVLPLVTATGWPAGAKPVPVPMSEAEAGREGMAALVDGKPIYCSELPVWDNISPEPSLRSRFSGDILKKKLAEAWRVEVEAAINRELVIEDAEVSGYQVPQKALDDRINFGVKGFGGSKEAFIRNLERNGSSLQKFNKRNREDLMYSHIAGLEVYDPANKYAAKIRDSGGKMNQGLFIAESRRLENQLLDGLRSRAVIQIFEEPRIGEATENSGQVPVVTLAAALKDRIQIEIKAVEIDDTAYLAAKGKIDAAINASDLSAFCRIVNNMDGVSLLSAPSVTTLPGEKAQIDVVQEVPYPTSFDLSKVGPGPGATGPIVRPTPGDFRTKEVGVSAGVTPSFVATGTASPQGNIFLNGSFTVTEFEGFTKSNVVGTGTPTFSTSESHFAEAMADGESRIIWIPGAHYGDNPVKNIPADGKTNPSTEIVKKRFILCLTARIVTADNSSRQKIEQKPGSIVFDSIDVATRKKRPDFPGRFS